MSRFDLRPKLFFDLDLDPKPLAVETVLIPLFFTEHRLKPLKEIFVGATPTMVHAHRVVRRDRPVDE